MKLDKEEQELLESFERGEWKPVKLSETEKKKLAELARNTRIRLKSSKGQDQN